MTIDVPPEIVPHVVVAIRMMARQAARDGRPVPAELEVLADTLLRNVTPHAQRRRTLAARRNARYRERQRERHAALVA